MTRALIVAAGCWVSARLPVLLTIAGVLAGIGMVLFLPAARWLQLLHWIAALVILLEAFNKLERTDLWAGRPRTWSSLAWLLVPWRWSRLRVVTAFKLSAWAFLAIGAAGAVAGPLLQRTPPRLQETLLAIGFALLIVRSRFKETVSPIPAQESQP